MRVRVLATTCLLAFAAPAFAQDTTAPSATGTAPTTPTTVVERGDAHSPSTATQTPRARHRTHHHAAATQHSDANLSTEVRPRAATAMPTPGSSVLGNRSDDPAGPTTVIKR